jgi:microcystin-dependent protein
MNDPNLNSINVTPPVGSITAFVGNVVSFRDFQKNAKVATITPIEAYGWMICDGSKLKAGDYPELYSVLGNLYGGEGTGKDITFCLPDLTGQFLRGIGKPDDKASHENRKKAEGGTQDGVGSTQEDAIQTHTHMYTKPSGLPTPGETGKGLSEVNDKAYTEKAIIDKDAAIKGKDIKVSALETRPTNTFVYYLIKYTSRVAVFNPVSHL